MGVFSDNTNPAPYQPPPPAAVRPAPGAQMGPPATPNRPMDIRAQANRAKQQGMQRQMMWKQMISGAARSAGLQLIQHRAVIDRFVDRVLYGTAP